MALTTARAMPFPSAASQPAKWVNYFKNWKKMNFASKFDAKLAKQSKTGLQQSHPQGIVGSRKLIQLHTVIVNLASILNKFSIISTNIVGSNGFFLFRRFKAGILLWGAFCPALER